MQIQFNTDSSVQGSDSLTERAAREISERLSRFRDHITRVEAHLTDVNGTRHSEKDKRCVLEVRLAGRQPIAVTHEAGKVIDALTGACTKAQHALDNLLGKERDAHRRDSIRGGESGEPA